MSDTERKKSGKIDTIKKSYKTGDVNEETRRKSSARSGKSNGLANLDGSGRAPSRKSVTPHVGDGGADTGSIDIQRVGSGRTNTSNEETNRTGSQLAGASNAHEERDEPERSATRNEDAKREGSGRAGSIDEDSKREGSGTISTRNDITAREGSSNETTKRNESRMEGTGDVQRGRNGSGRVTGRNEETIHEGAGRAGASNEAIQREDSVQQRGKDKRLDDSGKAGTSNENTVREEDVNADTSNGGSEQHGAEKGSKETERTGSGRSATTNGDKDREQYGRSGVSKDTEPRTTGQADRKGKGVKQEGSEKAEVIDNNTLQETSGNLKTDTKPTNGQKTETVKGETKREQSGKKDIKSEEIKRQGLGKAVSETVDLVTEEITRSETFTTEGNIEKDNFFRICKCLVKHIPTILGDILAIHVAPKKLRATIQKKKTMQLSHNQKHVINEGKIPDYTKFDITLFHLLFRSICPKCPNPSHDWGTYPKAGVEITVGDDIERIQKLKNNAYGHLDYCLLPTTKYNRMWEELGDLISRLEKLVKRATYRKALDEIGKARIDPLVDEEHVRTLKEWRDMDTQLDIKTGETLKQLEPEFRKTRKSVDKMKRITCSQPGILSRSRHDPDSIKSRMETMEENLLDTKKKVRQTKYIQKIRESTKINVQKLDGMRAYTKALLVDFEENVRPSFIETQNFNLAKRIFTDFGFVFLVGIPGEGKTAIGMHLLNQPYPDDLEQPIRLILTSPKQFTDTIDPTRKYILFIDDIFGKLCKDQSFIDGWTDSNVSG
ncbi:uncharacterized protein LOC110465286 [Mizuhopecten yessoensis]|uniref:uncharacterized protein LOC110465286 n=1 Tax=Mizuhopecten yessoensis TaxID=6573 RepID=UPI000B45C141|nr:uncharacterized protein LOC110465286 [Mizuhopecten yessoensis]